MGNTQPTNKTGPTQTQQRLENAKKLGILSLTENNLTTIPKEVYTNDIIIKLRVFDLSKNNLCGPLTNLSCFIELKTLQLDYNKLSAGSLDNNLSKLCNLQNLSLSNNLFGKIQSSTSATATNAANTNTSTDKRKLGIGSKIRAKTTTTTTSALSDQMEKQLTISSNNNSSISCLPVLPISLKQCNISNNYLSCIPPTLLCTTLLKLEKLDLSYNQLATIPDTICNLINLEELKIDNNYILILPNSIGLLTKLKSLSLKNNQLSYNTTSTSTKEQPIPESLFTNTKLIDLNLHGNINLTNTQLNTFIGFQSYLDRRQKVKSKLLSNLDTCGLD